MVDTLTKEERSLRMSLIRGKDTKPEKIVRSLVHQLGFRFRLHVRTVPGSPDLVFRSQSKVIFVHGCFWHRHDGCGKARIPKSRVEFWETKLNQNKARDSRVRRQLNRRGWRYMVIWECQVNRIMQLTKRIQDFLDN